MCPDDFKEIPDEEVPESLKKKWEREDFEREVEEKSFRPCEHCSKLIEPGSFSCIYCGERVFWDSGLLGGIMKTIARQRNFLYVLLLAVIAIIVFKLAEF